MTRQTRTAAFTTITLIVVLLAGCADPQPSATEGQPTFVSSMTAPPSATASMTAPSADVPTTSASATPAATGGLRMVVADELRMRTDPGIESQLVGGLERGDTVMVVSEPVTTGGFSWVEVVDIDGRRGWVAEGDGADAWLRPVPSESADSPMLSFEYGCDVTGPFNAPSTLIFDDGRVIHGFMGEAELAGAFLERRLSESGMEHLRETLFASPYLGASAEYRPVARPGAEPPGHGVCFFNFIIAAEGAPIDIVSIGWFGDEEESTFYEPSPERKALDGIARNLMAIDSALGESSWGEADWLPWVPTEHLLWLGPGDFAAPEDTVVVDPEDFGLGDLDTFGQPSGRGRCGIISAERVFQFARVLNEAGTNPPVPLHAPTSNGFRLEEGWMYYGLMPVTPGSPGCDEVSF